VATVIVIRTVLELSGYPKLAGGGLHIAHVLYGGIMMIVALLLLFTFLNLSARWAAAFLGGVGFGFFIDEVGKFISNDVNYFFEPAVAVMYVVFVVLFLALYAVRRGRLKPHDALANALSLLREERDGALDAPARRETLALLERADPADPLVPVLRDRVLSMPVRERRNLTPYGRWRDGLAGWYRRVAVKRWFRAGVVVVVVCYGVAALATLLTVALPDSRGVDAKATNSDLAHWVDAGAAGVMVLFIAIGLAVRRRSRVSSYRWYKRAILVSILVRQVFVFYHDQFAALVGVAFDLLIYAALSYMIAREEAEALGEPEVSTRPAAVPIR
jgi:hypothetical protein